MAIKKKSEAPVPQKTEQDFPIVGVGASAGGLDAFQRFLKAIPEDSGMAYVLVQHLDPNHESILPEILERSTKIPVHEITDKINLAPNNIYVIPENKILTSTDGILKLTPRNKIKVNAAIDVFFTTLAEVHQNLAIGVILSGTGADGTFGLKAIKAHGGITFAQDQQSAKYGEMPQNAVNAEVVDFILPPEKIPGKIVYIEQGNRLNSLTSDNLLKHDEEVYDQIILVLRKRSGVDFTYYKQTTVRRRIARRMLITENIELVNYLNFLKENTTEQDDLFHDMLIPVTSFFRDSKIFESVSQLIFPVLLKNKSISDPIRIWVAGCSTGEEAYSLAISLHQYLEKISGRQIQIFASDISEIVISKARVGIYRNVDVKNVPHSILKNYFTKTNGGYQVNKTIREMCVFAIHDFLKDPPFAKMDFITCRNVLIYMDTFLQKRALSTFHYALKDSGFLLLGKSETTGPAVELFTTFAKDDKIYSRKSVPTRFMQQNSERREDALAEKIKKTSEPEILQNDFRKSAEMILLSKFTPPNVIINEQMDVVQINGKISPFLEVPQGRPTFNLLKMAKEGLAFELRNALYKAKTTNLTVIKEGVLVKIDGEVKQITIEISPLRNCVEAHFLILFYKTILPEKKITIKGANSLQKSINDEALLRIDQLENEISLTREDMRLITQEQETANEELQSANEELLSSSEELQSLNEELETSKEELQSTNEELIISNQETLDKQEQINSTRLYAEAIIATVREPLVVLDKALRIKSINSSFSKMFNTSEKEVEGQLIYEIKGRLFDNLNLKSLLENVLSKKIEFNDFEISVKLQTIGNCTLVLNARNLINEKGKEKLILLAMKDITERKILYDIANLANATSKKEKLKAEEATVIAEEATKSKQQFLSNMSHEIRTPMNAIIGFTKILSKSELSEKQKEYLEAIETSGDRLIVLINDILDLAKVDEGKMKFSKLPFKMNASILSMLHLFQMKIQEKNIELVNLYDENIPEVLLGDSGRLHQIIINLIGNAVKFTSKGKITISTSLLDENDETVTIEFKISDTGIGIEKKKISTIFEKFQQATSETSSLYGGTGLGLAIVKQLVEAQGGSIDVKSEFQVGSIFSFILSFQKTKNGMDEVIEPVKFKEHLRVIKILVVEDIALNQLLMKTLLDDFGFEHDLASNGKLAIEKLKKNSYDVILMDLQMPEMNGFEATEYIRKKMHSTIPIIAITADVTTADLEKCKEFGMDDYLAKPIDEKLLYRKIIEAMK